MASSEIRFQDPGADAGYLLEALIQCCAGASSGGAIFAWTNSSGAESLLADKAFVKLVESGAFDLVVGVDSITDEAAIKVLIERDAALENLHVKVFLHEEERALFHPKLAWFETKKGLTLIVGSGNLTMGGLRANWEAFSISKVEGAEAGAIKNRLASWLEDWDRVLVPVTDPGVMERAKRNTGNERSLKRATKVPPETVTDGEASVLVAEIPKGGRWGQASFDLATYEGFFGAKRGAKRRRISLYNVTEGGDTGEVESRPGIEKPSQNYCFELAAAHGLDYPSVGPPIGTFVRLSTGQFLYMLVMPESAHRAALEDFLDARWKGRSRQKRRVRASVADLRVAWPKSPLWTAKLPQL